MKMSAFVTIVSVSVLTLSILAYELLSLYIKGITLEKNEVSLPHDSMTLQIVKKNRERFIESQKRAMAKKRKLLRRDITQQLLFMVVGIFFMNEFLRGEVFRLADMRVTILKNSGEGYRKSEVNALSLLFCAYICIYFWFSDITKSNWYTLLAYIYLFMCYFFVFPVVCIMLLLMLNSFGVKLVFSCYIAYIIKILPEIFLVESLNASKMTKIHISTFPEDIQKLLIKYELENSVYVEKVPSKNMNAALIGYGKGMRMEIYGDINKINKNKLFSIFLHELGHVSNRSFAMKVMMYLTLLSLELVLFLIFFFYISPLLSNEKVTAHVMFLIMAVVYRMSFRQWIFMNYKFVSQNIEMASDYFAKSYGYGKHLALVLYKISMDGNDYISPNRLYNVFRSGHPTTYERMEYLLS
jgi:Zn-dependent protease with chaperone function